MFSYVFMKILEMRPRSYDQRMDKVSRGRVRVIKEAVANEIAEGSHALEIGCGTGELAGMLIDRSCKVEGFDLSPTMVETARERIVTENLKEKFMVSEMGIDGMDAFQESGFDAVVSTLVFSELSDDERRFALKQAARVLKPGGRIVIADEVVPDTFLRRICHVFLRFPLVVLTYLVSSRSTRPLNDLRGELERAGFIIAKEERSHGGSFAMVVGERNNDGGDV